MDLQNTEGRRGQLLRRALQEGEVFARRRSGRPRSKEAMRGKITGNLLTRMPLRGALNVHGGERWRPVGEE